MVSWGKKAIRVSVMWQFGSQSCGKIACGKVEVSWDWTNLRKGDYWEKSAWNVKVYFIFVVGEPLDQEMIRLEKSSILTIFCDLPKCGEFSFPNYGDWYTLLLTIK